MYCINGSVCSASPVAGPVKTVPNILRNRRVVGCEGAEGLADEDSVTSESAGLRSPTFLCSVSAPLIIVLPPSPAAFQVTGKLNGFQAQTASKYYLSPYLPWRSIRHVRGWLNIGETQEKVASVGHEQNFCDVPESLARPQERTPDQSSSSSTTTT